jgi:hypothetical protein
MEKRINKKIHQYILDFKQKIKDEFDKCKGMDKEHYSNILQFIYDYPNMEINKCDLTKRKRVKNVVPLHERCCALRANEEQCTRRKKEGEDYCGTHIKGRPHGEVSEKKSGESFKKREVWAQDINGIIYYIDHDNNVYDHADIINGIVNPKIIAKYQKDGDAYFIPNMFE